MNASTRLVGAVLAIGALGAGLWWATSTPGSDQAGGPGAPTTATSGRPAADLAQSAPGAAPRSTSDASSTPSTATATGAANDLESLKRAQRATPGSPPATIELVPAEPKGSASTKDALQGALAGLSPISGGATAIAAAHQKASAEQRQERRDLIQAVLEAHGGDPTLPEEQDLYQQLKDEWTWLRDHPKP